VPELIFEDPHALPQRVSAATEQLQLVLLQMKEHPNKWVKLNEWPGQSGAYGAKKRLLTLLKTGKIKGKYEFEVRRSSYDPKPSGGSILYAKFIRNGD